MRRRDLFKLPTLALFIWAETAAACTSFDESDDFAWSDDLRDRVLAAEGKVFIASTPKVGSPLNFLDV